MNTKRVILLSFVFAVCGLRLDVACANPPTLPTFPPLEFHPPKPQRFVLPNGIVVFLLEDHELPLIKIDASIRAGTLQEPPERSGMTQIFGSVMTQGGSAHHLSEEILRTQDITGSAVAFSVGMEDASGAMNCRSTDFDKIFALFSDLLTAPQFRGDFLNLEKEKAQEGLRRMNDDPEGIARREFRHAVYGNTHPYSRTPTPETIDKIHRKDLLNWHARFFKPSSIMLAVSGDFQSAAMKQKLTESLGHWNGFTAVSPQPAPVVPPILPTRESALFYVQRPLDQSQIRIGHTGFARHNPDHFAWEIFNELWGGSATSLLFRTIRTQKGLAYSVASVFTEPNDLGLIASLCQTRGPETPLTVKAILDINRQAKLAPFTEGEVKSAKEAIRNRFVENFTSSAQIADQIMAQEFHGYPSDYLDTYTDKIAKVSLADLKRVAEKYLHPDQSVILIVGDLSTFNKPLSTIGKPREIRLPDYRLEANRP